MCANPATHPSTLPPCQFLQPLLQFLRLGRYPALLCVRVNRETAAASARSATFAMAPGLVNSTAPQTRHHGAQVLRPSGTAVNTPRQKAAGPQRRGRHSVTPALR